jgi:hypothetical protein
MYVRPAAARAEAQPRCEPVRGSWAFGLFIVYIPRLLNHTGGMKNKELIYEERKWCEHVGCPHRSLPLV